MNFAEFLNHSYPNRLGILYLSTCVGLGYGRRANSLLGFSRQHGISDSPCGSVSRLRMCEARICLGLSLHAYPGATIARDHLPSCVPLQLSAPMWVGSFRGRNPGHPLSNNGLELARTRRYRNVNRLCIGYASRPRLSSRLTLGGLAFPRNPWTSGGGASHTSFATHANILTRPRSTYGHPSASLRDRRSATARRHRNDDEPVASVSDLSPVTLSAREHSTSELLRTLSRVAASKPTSWLSGHSHIVYHLV